MTPQVISLSALGSTAWIPVDYVQNPYNINIAIVVSNTPNLTCKVEYTLDDIFNPAITPTAFTHSTLTGLTSNTTGNITSPVRAIRLTVTAWTSGTATMTALQGVVNPVIYTDQGTVAETFSTSAKTLWTNGMLFWIPAGDGGANGMNFTGDGSGTFSISAAFTGLTTGSFGFVLLPDNAGGSGNVNGWYYFVFTGATSGKIYTHTYDSTSEVYPTIPTSPTELSFVSSARITTAISEIQVCQIPINYVTQMGINGMLEAVIFCIGATEYLRAGSNLLYSNDQVGTALQSVYVNINSVGSLSKQITMRHNTSFGTTTSSLNGNYKTVDLAAETTLVVGLKLASTTANGIVCLHKLTASYGD